MMIVPDVNVLVHAYDSGFPEHGIARAWWEGCVNEGGSVGLAWATILGFLRVTTNRSVVARPLPVREAIETVRSWLEQPNVQILLPGLRHADLLFGLLEEAGAAGNLTTDAHLAALAIEYRAEIASTDADFARFPQVRCFNPLRPGRFWR